MREYLVNPVAVRADAANKGSIYEAIVAMGLRSRQINDDIKAQLQARMQAVMPPDDEIEGALVNNTAQMELSREFDKIPRPTFLAMKEMQDGQISYKIEARKERSSSAE